MNASNRTWIEIDLSKLEHNYREIVSHIPAECQVVGICKANAYGHGAVEVASRLQSAGCKWFAVHCFDEALALRRAGITGDILILGMQQPDLAFETAENRFTQTVGSLELAEALDRRLEGTGLRLNVHIKLDTGMGRTGFSTEDSGTEAAVSAMKLSNLNVTGIFTHFAVSDVSSGDAYTLRQLERYLDAVKRIEAAAGRKLPLHHCGNSGGVIKYPQTYLDLVRPGIMMYGVSPCEDTHGFDLKPVMSLRSRICAIAEHHKGDCISYGCTYVCQREMRIAVLPIGYADGLLRSLSGIAEGVVKGKKIRQVGRICMDMCMFDVTDMPDIEVGDVVTIFGDDISVSELAEKAGTIPNELLCAVSQRVPRVYLE